MSLRAIIEVIVQLESFRNIDLYQQGLYYLNFRLYHISRGYKLPASPYNFHTYEESSVLKDLYRVFPAQIEDTSFRSRCFLIKYSDEEVDLNDIGIFRTEIELSKDYQELNMIIEVDLMFYDLEGRIDEDKIKATIRNPPEFTTACTIQLNITGSLQGINAFYPIVFDENHCCVANAAFHVILIDFRFRPNPLLSPEEEALKRRGEILTDVEINLPKTLSQYMFKNATEITPELIDQVHDIYINQLIMAHEKNRKLMEEWINFHIPSKLKNSMPKIPNPLSQREENNDGDSTISTNASMNSLWRLPFSEREESRDPEAVAEKILMEIQEFAGQMYYLGIQFIDLIRNSPKPICAMLQYQYNQKLKDRWGESIFREIKKVQEFALTTDQKIGESHRALSRTLRKTPYYKNLEQIPVMKTNFFPPPEWHPIIFQDIYTKITEDEQIDVQDPWDPTWITPMNDPRIQRKGLHLIVLCHGFQGNSFDVRTIRNHIALLRPDCVLMCSHMNEGETEGDIYDMGQRLAREVLSYIEEWCPGKSLNKVSFIGHSLGGVIIRAALPHLESISDKMQFFLTLSSPHLGYMYNSSKLVDAGLWILKKWRKSQCLMQLSMTDAQNPRDSFIYKLSLEPGLEWFKHIALVSSFQDSYAPFESARIEVGPKAANDQSKGGFYIEMANNILSKITLKKLYRLDVNFKIKGKSIDTMIGRAAHILMLENEPLIQMILFCCTHFFELNE